MNTSKIYPDKATNKMKYKEKEIDLKNRKTTLNRK